MASNMKSHAKKTFKVNDKSYVYYDLKSLEEQGLTTVSKLPYSIRVLLESVLRQEDDFVITDDHIKALSHFGGENNEGEVPFKPSRVILQDFTGVPAVVDLASLRKAMNDVGGDINKINPEVPVDLVIDHSVQVDSYANPDALERNMKLEFERNYERYQFLNWATKAFNNYNAVPPATGIVHQVNLEYLANVVHVRDVDGEETAFPDTLVGTDSHTTMINGIGVLGWGVGGIEAEAGMLGQPSYFPIPEVIGVRLTNTLPQGSTATDLALRVTQELRKKGVVGKFVDPLDYDAFANIPLSLVKDGKEIATGLSNEVLGNPIESVKWLNNKLQSQDKQLKKDQIISSETFISPLTLEEGNYTASYGEVGSVDITVTN